MDSRAEGTLLVRSEGTQFCSYRPSPADTAKRKRIDVRFLVDYKYNVLKGERGIESGENAGLFGTRLMFCIEIHS